MSPATSNTGDPASFAYVTARERWPNILAGAIGELFATIKSHDLFQADRAAAYRIQIEISKLKEAMANNAVLQPLVRDGGPDIEAYNAELQTLEDNTWLKSPWLFTECYMYRLMHTMFSKFPAWRSFDVFTTNKKQSLVDSKEGAIELVKRFIGVLQAIEKKEAEDEGTQKAILEEMLQISLWGNATDLSLLTTLSVEDLNSRQGKAVRESSKASILVDDTEQVWGLLSQLKLSGSPGPMHIVLDNAGFELLTDLVFVGYILESGYANNIVLHGKRMPWFVSDVNAADLTDLIQGFADGTTYPDMDADDKHDVQQAGRYWKNLLDSGKMTFKAHPFWTTQHSYGRMATVAPELFEELASASLVVYKGDLNYRKLVYDGCWSHTTSFKEAMGPLAEKQQGGKGTRTLALRTCKADVCVGLRPGIVEELPGDWTRTGKYAVVSYYDAKS